MKYHLICKGKVRDEADEARVVIKLMRFTGRSTDEVCRKLLSGKAVKLKSSKDKQKIDGLHEALNDLGLDVEMLQHDVSISESISVHQL